MSILIEEIDMDLFFKPRFVESEEAEAKEGGFEIAWRVACERFVVEPGDLWMAGPEEFYTDNPEADGKYIKLWNDWIKAFDTSDVQEVIELSPYGYIKHVRFRGDDYIVVSDKGYEAYYTAGPNKFMFGY